MLNAGKTCRQIDLKSDAGRAEVEGLIARSDVLIEQFRRCDGSARPHCEAAHKINPRLIYCSITDMARTVRALRRLSRPQLHRDDGLLALAPELLRQRFRRR